MTVFLILAAGFVAVVYYNVKKMAMDDPLLSVKVENNTLSPSLLFCTTDPVDIKVESAVYTNINQDVSADLLESFNNFTLGELERMVS